MKRILALQVNDSQRATEMYVKTKCLTENRNGGSVVFASETPISNTLGEIYTVLRFLGGNILKEKEMEYFDLWAGNFTEKNDGIELSPSGNGFKATTFLTMTNLIANSKMLRQFAEIHYADDLPHLKRPKLKNGRR